ncbi:hypothetical protein CGRA01v4_02802 [Colletotrichum graminicola]|nr:hypothetical protein CGRA01v4_02802 [Colletotrichum graminicola]
MYDARFLLRYFGYYGGEVGRYLGTFLLVPPPNPPPPPPPRLAVYSYLCLCAVLRNLQACYCPSSLFPLPHHFPSRGIYRALHLPRPHSIHNSTIIIGSLSPRYLLAMCTSLLRTWESMRWSHPCSSTPLSRYLPEKRTSYVKYSLRTRRDFSRFAKHPSAHSHLPPLHRYQRQHPMAQHRHRRWISFQSGFVATLTSPSATDTSPLRSQAGVENE